MSARRRRSAWPFVCLAAFLVLACSIHVSAERLPIRTYTVTDGLPHNEVRRIVKDSRGFLWFCTAEGLARFDGSRFTSFGIEQGLPAAVVTDFLETRTGAFWVGTDMGLVRFDPGGRPGPVPAGGSPDPGAMFTLIVPEDPHRLARDIAVLREAADGTIWVGTLRGLLRLDRARDGWSLSPVSIGLLDAYPDQRQITDLLEDRYQTLWVATRGGLYRRWPDGQTVRYTMRDGFPKQDFTDLFEDHDQRLWAATGDGGFFSFKFDGSHAAPVVDLALSMKDGLPTNWVTQLLETSDGRFWVATALGLVEYFPNGAADGLRLRTYTPVNGLGQHYVRALGEDSGGNLWLTTESVGASRLARGGFVTFGEQDGVRGINDIFEDRAAELCFRGVAESGSDASPETREVGCFDGRRFRWFQPAGLTQWGWARESITLRARSGEWWVGSQQGLLRYPATGRFDELERTPARSTYHTLEGQAETQTFRLLEDSRGDVWISSISLATYGLSRWEARTGRVENLAGAPGLPSLKDDVPRAFGEDSHGNVWIAFNSALVRYSAGRFQPFTGRDGLPRSRILGVYRDHLDRLWFATERDGVVRLDDPGAARPHFVNLTTAEGLSSNNTRAIVEDRDGYLYIGGGRGLDRLDPTTGRVKQFTVADGLKPGFVVAAYRDRRGALWFGLTTGLARLTPGPERPNPPPSVFIDAVRVSSVPQLVSALGERAMTLADLAPAQREVQIDFVGPAFGVGEVLRYQYRLGEDEWSIAREQRSVTYARLLPGRYDFAVRAVNSDGIASVEPATVRFRVLRPVWQRWWFLGLSALMVGLLVVAVVRARVNRLLDVAHMRAHIATDLHDDIGANLTRIALLSEVARQAPSDRPLDSIARIARESVGSMGDIVWAINPKRESLLDLIRRMRQHADEVFTLRGIDLRFDAPEAAGRLKLDMDVRRDLLLIFKEAINNVARHSTCTSVEVVLRVADARLQLRIADNGIGFDTSSARDGQGLDSMQRRARRLGGSLSITSGVGAGTVITLDTPLRAPRDAPPRPT